MMMKCVANTALIVQADTKTLPQVTAAQIRGEHTQREGGGNTSLRAQSPFFFFFVSQGSQFNKAERSTSIPMQTSPNNRLCQRQKNAQLHKNIKHTSTNEIY